MRLAPLPPPYYTNEKKKSPLIKWLIVTILLLIIIALIYFTYTNRKRAKNENVKDENIIKDASEYRKEEYSNDEIKIPTVEANNNDEVTEEEKQELELPSSYIANTNNELLSKEFLYKTEISKIKLIRDEIYARHGYIFKDLETQKYFEDKTWYVKNPNYTDELLNDMEVQNLEIISSFLNEDNEIEKIDKE